MSDQPDPLATVRAALDHVDDIGPARGLVALRNAAPAIADLCREVEALRAQVCRLTDGTAIESDHLCYHHNEHIANLAVIAELRERLNATREELRDAVPDEEA